MPLNEFFATTFKHLPNVIAIFNIVGYNLIMALFNTTTQQDFDDKVINSKKVVLVDFWAAWCPPCRAMAPILEKVAEGMDKDVDVVKVNIEDGTDNQNLAAKYQIRSIPNMHIFNGGRLVDNIVGMVPQPFLEDKLKKTVAS